ncbi:MAG: sodium:solute symporter family protein [Candidatus Amoebophilus sp.]
MPKISIDIIIFIVFLLANLIIGLWVSRHVKTLRDYSIGSKDFSTGTLAATIVATWIGGGAMFSGLPNIYSTGLWFIIPLLGSSLGLLLTGLVTDRMGEFLNNLSVAEAMGDLYGKLARIITAFSGILWGIGSLAIQFKVVAKIITLIFGFEGAEVTIIAALIIIIYSAFGGIRAVTITDIFEFFAFGIFIPILALVIWNGIKEPHKALHVLTTNPIFSFKQLIGWNIKSANFLTLLIYSITPTMMPAVFQRIVMAKDLVQARKAYVYAAGISILMFLFLIWIAILLLADNPNLVASNLVNFIIDNHSYPFLKSLIGVGVVAMAVSTADSHLNASVVLFVNDILKPLEVFDKNDKKLMLLTRALAFTLGVFALLLALSMQDLFAILLLAANFYMPIVSIPLLLAIFGFRSTKRATLMGMSAGFLTVLLGELFFSKSGFNTLGIGMVANLVFLMGSHYILREKGGWVGIKEKEPLLAARQKRREAWQHFTSNIKNTKIYDYLQKNLPSYEVIYPLFAVYVIGATYASLYTISENTIAHYQSLYNSIYHSVLLCTAAFLTYPAWPLTIKSKRFITFAWPAGIFYILFVVGTILVLMSGFHETQIMIFMVNLIMAAFLLSWPLMLTLSFLGTIIGCLIFYMYCGDLYACSSLASSGQFKLIYAILLISSFLIALFRFKQEKKILQNRNIYLERLYEEKNNELVQILAYREEVLKDLSSDEKMLLDQTTAAYIQQILYRMTDYMRLEVTTINLDQLLLEVKDILKLKELDNMTQLITKRLTKEEFIHGDAAKLKQLLVNAILYVQKHNLSNQPITVIVEDAKLGHRVDYIKDYTRQLAALKFTITIEKDIPTKKDLYMIDQLPLLSQHTRKGKLIENARIIHAHYGYANLGSEHTQVYVLPINVREVRGKVMELLREPVEVDGEEVRHPLAIELEKELMDKIKGEKIDLKVINKALDTIKRYHAGVKRKSGEPFFTHPINVALILLEYCQDQDAVVAALLHDTVEDTSLSLVQIRSMFGEDVAFIVNKVTNLEDNLRRISLQDHENLYRLMNYEDKRAAYVKLADRLHNMRTISGHPSLAKQKHIASETLSFFVGLAEKLDLTAVAQELKNLSLEVLGKK